PGVDRGAPPPGLQAPVRGFGYVWSRSDELFNGLGWATDQERGFCAVIQNFEHGFMARSTNVPSCTAEGLYNHATAPDFSPVLVAASDDGRWRNVPAPTVPAESGGERPAGTLTRPANHGIFDAPRLDGLIVDAEFNEWGDQWTPINAIVFGLENHDGPGDLSANFQVAWLEDGLALAVRVNDERFRPGPEGTNQWQGDGLEIQFDRRLAEDFNSTQADDDDYQIGLALDPDDKAVRGYHWLPLSKDGPIGVPAAALLTNQGWVIETLIPWYIFDLSGEGLSSSVAYGFNISVNDNDGDAPAQQTVASASSARTTHDNPTEWGTLRLLP
ncbi:MAG TPA: sugar-binding protein, partial [Caldilineaceae bacterium]|nr:sugar-binding protein [Caldilineaceae bacterium]